jgi:hypothetical protein
MSATQAAKGQTTATTFLDSDEWEVRALRAEQELGFFGHCEFNDGPYRTENKNSTVHVTSKTRLTERTPCMARQLHYTLACPRLRLPHAYHH